MAEQRRSIYSTYKNWFHAHNYVNSTRILPEHNIERAGMSIQTNISYSKK